MADYLARVPVSSGSLDFYVRAGERDSVQLSGDMFSSLLRPLHSHVWIALSELGDRLIWELELG